MRGGPARTWTSGPFRVRVLLIQPRWQEPPRSDVMAWRGVRLRRSAACGSAAITGQVGDRRRTLVVGRLFTTDTTATNTGSVQFVTSAVDPPAIVTVVDGDGQILGTATWNPETGAYEQHGDEITSLSSSPVWPSRRVPAATTLPP